MTEHESIPQTAGRWIVSAGCTLGRWTLALVRELCVNIAALAMWAADQCSGGVAWLDARCKRS